MVIKHQIYLPQSSEEDVDTAEDDAVGYLLAFYSLEFILFNLMTLAQSADIERIQRIALYIILSDFKTKRCEYLYDMLLVILDIAQNPCLFGGISYV